ncbi:hypothetical protein ACFE04_011914 [Oxalis oulophora]
MLSGVRFIPRDKIDDEIQDENSKGKSKKPSRSKKDKQKRSSKYSSSDDDKFDQIKKKSSRKDQKWYSSEEDSSSSESDEKRRSRKKRKQKSKNHSDTDSSGVRESKSIKKELEIARKEMGLDWMLRPAQVTDRKPTTSIENEPQEKTPVEEVHKVNPRELNPYYKNEGSGYPDEENVVNMDKDQHKPYTVFGDGGASWRLKALKRAREQAAREGRNFEEIVEERWGSVGELALSTMSTKAAPSRAHLNAIRNRQRGQTDEHKATTNDESRSEIEKNSGRDYPKRVSSRHPDMRAPKVQGSLSWGKRKSQPVSSKDDELISATVSSMNKFQNDGSFFQQFQSKNNDDSRGTTVETKMISSELDLETKGMSANQLAAKAMQLKIKGKHEEAEKLLQSAQSMKSKQDEDHPTKLHHHPVGNTSTSRHVIQDFSVRKNKEDDGDLHLAKTITHNKQYGKADDEYDYEVKSKSRKKGANPDHKTSESNFAKRILTQQERCILCFENPKRPKHLVVSIGNFSYLMLPQYQSIVPGHCCILPLQHESATRNVDNDVWDEIRNFKKCLIMMFGKQDKELVFLETAMGLAQQRHHCLIECIPLPKEIAKQAPVYFKKAIDEAEDEWSQHNAKKLIDTSEKGLRGSIPKNFPYFHVEFGLNRGFVHVIDDESQFNSSLGLNVIRGMLELAEEDMYRRRRQESVEAQRQAVISFAKDWEPFDWTKQLG